MQALRKTLHSVLFALAAASFAVAHAQTMSATYVHNTLQLTIPYQAGHTGTGRLAVDVLSPEDDVLGHSEKTVSASAGDGTWTHQISLANPIPFNELIWDRVRYRFQYNGDTHPAFEDIRSISNILRRPTVRILGQTSYLAGAQAAIRIIVSDRSDAESAPAHAIAIADSTIRIELNTPHEHPHTLFTGRLDHRGTTQADFRFPAGLIGDVTLHFIAETPLGTAETTQNVRLEDKVSLLLTTEKPIYQPSQTIHVRALALDRAEHHAAADRPLTFELEDSRGNKVFRKATTTDAFGIASAEFALADEVNLGAYHLRALMGSTEAPSNTAQVTLNVQRYVLPKFRVAIDFAKKNGKPQRDYRPGDHVTGVLHAKYFFGKPVDNATLTLKASGMDVSLFEAVTAEGHTDNSGDYRFDLKLPSYFAGRPLNQRAAPVLIEATVKDAASHTETRSEPITVTQSPLIITAVPEGGKLIPDLENRIYVLASYPDGSPAPAQLIVHTDAAASQKIETDKGGIGVLHLTPTTKPESLRIEADDHHGNRASATVHLESRSGDDQLLLRANRAVFKPGERIDLSVLSTLQHGTAYIDIVKDGQTILTRDIDIANGRADLSLHATPQMSGTIEINAYTFSRSAQAIADHRLLFVQPADELHIETVADAGSYIPGADAHVHFRVTNARGEGVSAALGLEVVDEAVFALAEKQPGFAKVFFYLEQELMKPRYEIHSLSISDAIDSDQHDRAATVLFSAAETVKHNALDTEFGRELPQDSAPDYTARYLATLTDYVRDIAAKLPHIATQDATSTLIARFNSLVDEHGAKPHDPWGKDLRIESIDWWQARQPHYFNVRSAGPDRQFNTADDLTVQLQIAAGTIYGPGYRTGIILRTEHNRGPFNNLAEISGTVADPTGAAIPRATVTLHHMGDRAERKTLTNDTGSFTLSGIPAGRYTLQVTSPGFTLLSRQLTLNPRDLATATVNLNVGSQSEAVMVDAAVDQVEAFHGGIRNGAIALGMAIAAPPPPAKAAPDNGRVFAKKMPQSAATDEPAADTHVRSFFPEALYINPEILTDGSGAADITIPMADSITTWRMAMFASTKSGALGSAASSLKVFKDFFIDLDLPITLTQGDRISIPVGIYNYAAKSGEVTLNLQPEDWFSLVDDDATKTVSVDAGQVGGSQFTLEAKRIGKFKLTLSASMNIGSESQDVVVREIEVVPNGRQQEIVFNGRLDSTAEHTIRFPDDAIPEASKLFVRLYPGPLSQIIEGMDGILQMPGGCFEQTSSSTYPNVLALDYMKRTKKLTPEVHAKAEGYIANGYQRLLTFEVPGGGFSWFGRAPANKILTAYGLMEFAAMSKVYDVDPRLIARTRDWLIAQQQPNGSWKPDTEFINEGATNRYNSDALRITAYIAWSLEKTGYNGPAIDKARRFIEDHLSNAKPDESKSSPQRTDAYTLAVLANFAVDADKDSALTHRILPMLIAARTEKDEQVWWSSEETGVYSTGSSAAVETTGLAIQALFNSGQNPAITRKALAWLISKKSGNGNWGSTQATIMALQAVVLASERGSADSHGTLEVILNGKTVHTLQLTSDNNDLFHQFVLPATTDSSKIELRFEGAGGIAYQIAGRYFVPWPDAPAVQPLSIDVAYDRTRLHQNDIVTATATIHSNLSKTANMVMVDLGIPPGFDLLTEDLQDAIEKTATAHSGRLEKFSLTATQAILYFDSIEAKDTVKLHVRLRAKYPIRAKNFESRVYEYYDPAVTATARPVQFEVTGK